jgi:hypothetical protein
VILADTSGFADVTVLTLPPERLNLLVDIGGGGAAA